MARIVLYAIQIVKLALVLHQIVKVAMMVITYLEIIAKNVLKNAQSALQIQYALLVLYLIT